jgi:DNA (cytosine-5)-methyltransferase 1
MGRAAPAPTEPGKTGERLSPRFVEWLVGLDAGWVTDTGIPRNAQLKCLGNIAMPQQAAYAIRYLMTAATTLESS